jgi:hypothetical protein
MFITTSRDPSAKARRLARVLASFLSIDYVNRGKQRPDPEETWLVVTEDHGNPAGLVKRQRENEQKLSFRLSGEIEAAGLRPMTAAVVGARENAAAIADFLELEWLPLADSSQGRQILVAPGRIDFLDEGEARLRLKI